jgi:hypothetical protein
MKSYLARPALALAVSLALASCGGGGKETFPVKVTVFGVQYEDLVLSTNGMDLPIHKPAKDGDPVVATFKDGLDYGTYYNVVPKGGTATNGEGSQPQHQSCVTANAAGLIYPREYGTAGQSASVASARTAAVEVFYACSIKAYALGGTVTGLQSGTLTLINGSNGGSVTVTGDPTKTTPLSFLLPDVPFDATFGITVLTQPEGYTCTVGAKGTGKMGQAQEDAGGVKDVEVSCVKNPT